MTTEAKIIGREFKHGTYSRNRNTNDDMIVVKEYVHYDDGTKKPMVSLFKNYIRSFWVTKDGLRNHKDKKEWEDEKNLREFKCTHAEMPNAIARALGKPGIRMPMQQLTMSPYLYGSDIPTTSLLKYDYQKKWPNHIGVQSSVAVLDIETDVVKGTEDIICISLTFGSKCILAATKAFVGSLVNPEKKVQDAFIKYLGKYAESRKINLEFVIADTPALACIEIFKKAHEWKPDFITVWNILFDLPKIENQLAKEGFAMADVLSDPAVPVEFRHYRFKEGPTHQIAASGRPKLMTPAERWHVVESTSSFYFVDAMCLYKRIRIADGNLNGGYSLDNVLFTELGERKLTFKEVSDDGPKLLWHREMQTNYKIEYMIYNLFDCISVELLDEQTGDICRAFSALCGISDYNRFKSNPKRIVDDLHFYCRDHGLVIGTFAETVTDELDKHVVEKDGWIITLPSHLLDDTGICLFDELPNIRSTIRCMVADLDIEGTYPNVEDIMNISRETTFRELDKIKGLSLEKRRMVGINLTGGVTNAMEICIETLKLPTPDMLLEAFREENAISI